MRNAQKKSTRPSGTRERPGSSATRVKLRRVYDAYSAALSGNYSCLQATVHASDQADWAAYSALYAYFRVVSIEVKFVPAATLVNAVQGGGYPGSTASPWRVMATNKVYTAAPTSDTDYAENNTTDVVSSCHGWTKVWTNDMRAPRSDYQPTSTPVNVGGVVAYLDGEATAGSDIIGAFLVTYTIDFNSAQ